MNERTIQKAVGQLDAAKLIVDEVKSVLSAQRGGPGNTAHTLRSVMQDIDQAQQKLHDLIRSVSFLSSDG